MWIPFLGLFNSSPWIGRDAHGGELRTARFEIGSEGGIRSVRGLPQGSVYVRMGRRICFSAKSKGWVPSRGDTGTGFMYPTTPADLFSGGLGILGAVLLISGSFISWATAGGSLTSDGVDAISDSNGIGTLITGALCGVCSMLLLNGQRKRWVGLLFSIIAVVALILTIYSIADIINTSDGIPKNLIERFPNIDSAYANKAKLDLGTGVWLALGGSVASLLAGISGFKRNA